MTLGDLRRLPDPVHEARVLWAMLTDAAFLALADDLELEDLTEPGNRHLLTAIRELQEAGAEVTLDAACQAFAMRLAHKIADDAQAIREAHAKMDAHIWRRIFVEQGEPYWLTWWGDRSLAQMIFAGDLRALRISADLRRKALRKAA